MEFLEEIPLFPQEDREKQSAKDWSDEIFETSIPLFGNIDDGRATLRGATIKAGKYFIDDKKEVSVTTQHPFSSYFPQ